MTTDAERLLADITASAQRMSVAFREAGEQFAEMMRKAFPPAFLAQVAELNRAEVKRVHSMYRQKRKGRW